MLFQNFLKAFGWQMLRRVELERNTENKIENGGRKVVLTKKV